MSFWYLLRLFAYCAIKSVLNVESFLDHIDTLIFIQALTSSESPASALIEIGRHLNIDQENRFGAKYFVYIVDKAV